MSILSYESSFLGPYQVDQFFGSQPLASRPLFNDVFCGASQLAIPTDRVDAQRPPESKGSPDKPSF